MTQNPDPQPLRVLENRAAVLETGEGCLFFPVGTAPVPNGCAG